MAEQKSKPSAFVLLGQLALSVGLWMATYVFANQRLTFHQNGTATRVLLAALGIGGFLPWIYVCRRAILAEDEFSQRIHFVAMSIAFALTGIASFTCDFLSRAGFIPELPLGQLWMAMVIVWWLSMFATSRYYR